MSALSQPTPGPWKVVRLGDGTDKYRIGSVQDPHGRRICTWFGNASYTRFPTPEVEANARLIAQAPAMRVALKKMRAAVDELLTEFVSKKRAAKWDIIDEAVAHTARCLSLIEEARR